MIRKRRSGGADECRDDDYDYDYNDDNDDDGGDEVENDFEWRSILNSKTIEPIDSIPVPSWL